MGAPAKFLFDLDFASPDAGRTRGATDAEVAQQIAAAESRGYRLGFEAAQREAAHANERQVAQALTEISVAISGISSRFDSIETRMETEAVDVAVAVARKLAGAILDEQPLAEITALVSDCFRHLVATPHLVVRIGDALYDVARIEIEKLAKASGFQGRLVILAEPDIVGGDCRIEWADGGVVLENAATEAKITELVGRYMTSRNQNGAMPALRMTP